MHLNRLMQYYAYVLITNLRKTKDTTMSNVCVKFDAIDKMHDFFSKRIYHVNGLFSFQRKSYKFRQESVNLL